MNQPDDYAALRAELDAARARADLWKREHDATLDALAVEATEHGATMRELDAARAALRDLARAYGWVATNHPTAVREHLPLIRAEALLSTEDGAEPSMSDQELPGMWERADFMGGLDEVRGPAEDGRPDVERCPHGLGVLPPDSGYVCVQCWLGAAEAVAIDRSEDGDPR